MARWLWVILFCGACQSSNYSRPEGATRTDAGTSPGTTGRLSAAGRARSAAESLFARAHHLDSVLGDQAAAEKLYRKLTQRLSGIPGDDLRVQALAHLRLADLCRLRRDRRCAMAELDWLINRAARHPDLAQRAERTMVRLLHPQAGKMSALTRGPPAGFTSLVQVPGAAATQFQSAEKALLRYVRVRLSFRMHNVDAVRSLKRARLNAALKAYEPLRKSRLPNVKAAAFFRQGSLHQDYAEALGRVQVPEEFLPREAAKLRAKLHVESVSHFRSALERYRAVRQIADVAADRWRRAAKQFVDQLARLVRRRPGAGGGR